MKKTNLLAVFAAVAMIGNTAPAIADNTAPQSSFSEADMIQYANGFHLAYIRSGSNRLDSYTESAMTVLANRLRSESNIPLRQPVTVALDLERDDLNLFPMIFWSVTNQSKNMSETARAKLQDYIDRGGILYIDTRDISTSNECSSTLLRDILGHLDTRPFIPMPEDHTMTKTFFLLQDFTSAQTDNPLCIENNDENDIESLSNIIISDIGLRELIPQQTSMNRRDLEMLTRQLFNIVIYANTGDYKKDLTHSPAIIQRTDSTRPR